MVDVLETKAIYKKIDKIFDYVKLPENDPKWISGIKKVETITEAPLKIGSKVKREARFLGKPIPYVMEVRDYAENQLILMESVQSPFPMKVTYCFEPKEDHTVTSIRIQGGSKGFFKLADPLVSLQVRRSLKKDLRNLKAIMEMT